MSISTLVSNGGLQTAAPTNYPSQPLTAATPSSAPDSTATNIPGATVQVSDATTANPTAETVKKAAATVENFVNAQANVQTQVSVDKISGMDVIKFTDTATNQVITQYPSKAIVALAQAIEQQQGQISTTGVLHNSIV
jgi:uncharacterized FlaG/YvyC family protein